LQANSKNRSKFVPDFFVPNQLSGLEQFPHAPSARGRVATKKASRQIHENVAVLHVDTFFPPPKEYVVINVKAMSYIAVSTDELE